MENGKCASHGGRNKPGVDHPAIKHGLRSDPAKTMAIPGGRKASGLPTRFYDDVMAAAEDPNLTSLYDEILIIDSRISDLMKRIDTGESGMTWMNLQQLAEDWAAESGMNERDSIMNRIFITIRNGATDHQTWMDINMNMEQKARLIRAETSRMKDMDMLIRADRVLLLIRAVVEIVMRKVTDTELQEEIRVAIGRLLDRPEVNLHGGL